ncbi:hypothetical protein V6N13_055540 [Hibiscus sabdariffa]
MLELLFLVLTVLLLVLFLFTSADLPLNIYPIRLRPRNFSIAVALLLLASIFCPPSLFWPIHLFVVASYPCHGLLFHLFENLFRWFYGFLRLLPTYSVTIVTPNEGSSSSRPPLPDDIEVGRIQEQDPAEHSDSGV